MKLSLQVPQSHRGEAQEIEIFRNSTVGFPLDTETLSRIATHSLYFQQLCGENLRIEARVYVIREKASTSMKYGDSESSEVPGILFEGQGI